MVDEGEKLSIVLRKSLKKYRNKTGNWRLGGSILKTKTREEESEPCCSRGSTCKWGQVSFRIQKGCKWKIVGKAESTKKMQRDPQ